MLRRCDTHGGATSPSEPEQGLGLESARRCEQSRRDRPPRTATSPGSTAFVDTRQRSARTRARPAPHPPTPAIPGVCWRVLLSNHARAALCGASGTRCDRDSHPGFAADKRRCNPHASRLICTSCWRSPSHPHCTRYSFDAWGTRASCPMTRSAAFSASPIELWYLSGVVNYDPLSLRPTLDKLTPFRPAHTRAPRQPFVSSAHATAATGASRCRLQGRRPRGARPRGARRPGAPASARRCAPRFQCRATTCRSGLPAEARGHSSP